MKAHVCIGGPLDGEFATGADFHGGYEKVDGRNDYKKPIEGMYEHLKNEYHQFNNAGRAWNRTGSNVVWIHTSVLKGSIPARER